ncbi:MAG: dihydroorotate dehydrogenase electron transfer subunit [Bacteroidales bacterium]|nr:dihydroorotate dehydrogenase electron transfer subunit [Bacteroidales bacterium]
MKKFITDFVIKKKIVYNDNYFSLVLQHPSTLPEIEAGQFVEVEVPGNKQVMLRRPISIHDVDSDANTMTLLIQVVGKGTRTLSQMNEGESLNLVYPLGHGFSQEGKNVLLVGGGAGIAPLLHLSKCLKTKGVAVTILLGGRTESLIPVRDEFRLHGTLGIATEDGSLGEKGLVTQHSLFSANYDRIYTCGPTPMMKAVARYALEKGIECEVSLENMMACGVGACLCCVVDSDKGHKCVCKEGPVFNAKELSNWICKMGS